MGDRLYGVAAPANPASPVPTVEHVDETGMRAPNPYPLQQRSDRSNDRLLDLLPERAATPLLQR